MILATHKGFLRMAEFVGLLTFLVLAVAVGTSIAPRMLPAVTWLLAAGVTIATVAGLLYVGGVVLELPITWLNRTRLGRVLASDQAGELRRAAAWGYWGILLIMAAGMVALGRYVGSQ